MRQSRSSSIKEEIKEMEIQKLNTSDSNSKLKEEAHLSGAYIRSLVKQLTSSNNNPETMSEFTTKPLQPAPPAQQQPHKKQVRRRLHTSRPYQERLLNMAEARREIVTALKFHRASMKQATENQNQNQNPNPPILFDHHQRQQQQEEADAVTIKCRRNHRVYPASSSSSSSSSSSNIATFSPYQAQYIWPNQNTTITNLPLAMDHQTLANFPLPNQALGLNLNFQDFNNIDFSSATISAAPTTSVPSAAAASPSSISGGGVEMHAAMDEEAIAEIKSMGEQHEIEWSDTMNLVTSAYWSNLLSPEEDHHRRDHFPFDHHYHDQFPSWLSAGELTHHLDDSYSSDDYFNNSPSLSSMDIGEIDGMDGDWLA